MHEETLTKQTHDVFDAIKDLVADFYLAGGTALALHLGHRMSVDLDFFTSQDFNVQNLLQTLGTRGYLEIDTQTGTTVNAVLDGVKISFFKIPFELLFPTKDFYGVVLADERDVAAMKILAISGRGSKKDFFDMYVLLQKYSLSDLLNFFHHKYQQQHYNMMHILKSLDYFADADEEIDPILLVPISWTQVKKTIQEVVKKQLVRI